MDIRDAAALIAGAVTPGSRVWADLGSGSGTFTRALASLLHADARIYAVERDASAIETLHPAAGRRGAEIVPVHADFQEPLDLPPLDGALLANALHFVPYSTQAPVLRRIVAMIRPGGHLAVVEYDRRAANPWVPYPVSLARFGALAADLGLPAPTQVGSRPSDYSGIMYSAFAVVPRTSGS